MTAPIAADSTHISSACSEGRDRSLASRCACCDGHDQLTHIYTLAIFMTLQFKNYILPLDLPPLQFLPYLPNHCLSAVCVFVD